MKFSVIIPTYMEEQCIEQCLSSLKQQDYDQKEFEIIVSDAMSTDKTVEIANKYTSNIISSAKRGIAHGRNNGAAGANGEILLFLDADATLAPDFLSRFEKTFYPQEILAATGIAHPADGRFLPRFVYHATYLLVRLFGFFGVYLFPGICVAYRRTVFMAVKGFREDFGIVEDLDLSRRVSIIGKCRVVPSAHAYVSTRRLERHLWSTVIFHIYSDVRYLLNGTASNNYPKMEEVHSWRDLWTHQRSRNSDKGL